MPNLNMIHIGKNKGHELFMKVMDHKVEMNREISQIKQKIMDFGLIVEMK